LVTGLAEGADIRHARHWRRAIKGEAPRNIARTSQGGSVDLSGASVRLKSANSQLKQIPTPSHRMSIKHRGINRAKFCVELETWTFTFPSGACSPRSKNCTEMLSTPP